MIYPTLLFAHSWIRWLVLGLGVAVLVQRSVAWRGKARPQVTGVHRAFVAALDIQLVLGLLLYLVFSPVTKAAFADFGATMGVSLLRFYSVEHVFGMISAIAAAHIGFDRLRRSERAIEGWGPALRFAFIAQAIWLIVTVASIPWPGLPYGRPLLRFFLPG